MIAPDYLSLWYLAMTDDEIKKLCEQCVIIRIKVEEKGFPSRTMYSGFFDDTWDEMRQEYPEKVYCVWDYIDTHNQMAGELGLRRDCPRKLEFLIL